MIARDSKKKVVCFGNKAVEKNTREYYIRRENNNIAVKKCRKKLERLQKIREDRVNRLLNENKYLSSSVDALSKELNVLKEVIIDMNPNHQLPEQICQMLAELEK
ncbi:CCAAT enhancer binding [Brachionus plicatilis]|uniref:CCAAT enhancer binding n=1 Tax=Brachionus plicatilis TaxID=10195 RepID=A0A3M7SMB3_BRAPC|nr:CCAAT enhancer binding [Brachionus plicatilis]